MGGEGGSLTECYCGHNREREGGAPTGALFLLLHFLSFAIITAAAATGLPTYVMTSARARHSSNALWTAGYISGPVVKISYERGAGFFIFQVGLFVVLVESRRTERFFNYCSMLLEKYITQLTVKKCSRIFCG